MQWREMTIGRKIALGFRVVLVMLGVMGILSYTGVNSIVSNAEQVIDGNKLDGLLAQKEVDHLNWANKVNALLTDDGVSTLDVEVDHRQCACGKWLYGEGRQKAEAQVPSLAPLLDQLEAPHKHLHESAKEIGQIFEQADLQLGNFLREKKTDHLAWAHQVNTAVSEMDSGISS